MILRAAVALCLLASPALADCTRHTVEEAGFSSLAYVTTDPDWQEKWLTPREVVPNISCTDQVAIRETGVLLVFFHGASVVDGHFAVDCDIHVTDPTGEVLIVDQQPCAHFVLNGRPSTDVYLTIHQIGVLPDPDELGRSYHIVYGLTDIPSGRRIVHEIDVPVIAVAE